MANRSYLCATNQKTTYPSVFEEGFEPTEQTLASDVWCVPLLWLALFRAEDIVREVVPVEEDEPDLVIRIGQASDSGDVETDDDGVTEAPIVSRTRALARLQEAVPYFNTLFSDEGPLDEHAAFLQQALEAVRHQFVTIELDEIACMTDPKQEFHDEFRAILTGIGSDMSPTAKERLVRLAGFRNLKRFPPARLTLDGPRGDPDDAWNHCRILGAGAKEGGIGRAVPWETEPMRTRYLANAPNLVPVFMPRLELVLGQHEERKASPLTKEEVFAIRDKAVCLMVPVDEAARLPRGTKPDIDPANCWEEWLALREHRGTP